MIKDLVKAKKGDTFIEKNGFVVMKLEIVTDPVCTEGEWTWSAKILSVMGQNVEAKGSVVDYLVREDYLQYAPNLYFDQEDN